MAKWLILLTIIFVDINCARWYKGLSTAHWRLNGRKTDMTTLTTPGKIELNRVMHNLAHIGFSEVLLPIGDSIRDAVRDESAEVRFRHNKNGTWVVWLRKVGLGH
jgi:hypothetical protein